MFDVKILTQHGVILYIYIKHRLSEKKINVSVIKIQTVAILLSKYLSTVAHVRPGQVAKKDLHIAAFQVEMTGE